MMTKANTKYKTVKRKANVGERILITDANISMGFYGNGDVLTVESHYNGLSSGITAKETRQDCPFIRHEEYEVIVEESSSNSERITALETQVAELQAELQTLKKRKKPKHLLTHYPTPNEQRKAVIERANAFVADTISKNHKDVIPQGLRFGVWFVNESTYIKATAKPEFIVNVEKRTVVALIRRINGNEVHTKGIAKCAPDDIFNADIGKAIALGRALGLDVSEFENAPKPTEVVVGMVVYDDDKSAGSAGNVIVEEVRPPGYCNANDGYTYADGWAWLKKAVIIDDTEAQY